LVEEVARRVPSSLKASVEMEPLWAFSITFTVERFNASNIKTSPVGMTV
jgi:hypothetical protein